MLEGPDCKAKFHLLEREKIKIESELGEALDWKELPGNKESHISLHHYDCDFFNRLRWEEYQIWMAEHFEKFKKIFEQRVKRLNPDDYNSEVEEKSDEN